MKKKILFIAVPIVIIVAAILIILLQPNEDGKENDNGTIVGDIHISKAPQESEKPGENPVESNKPAESNKPQDSNKPVESDKPTDKPSEDAVSTTAPPYHIANPDTMITDGVDWVVKDIIATTTAPDGSKVDIYEDGYTFCLAHEKGNKAHVNPIGRMVIFEANGKGLELKNTISEEVGKSTWSIKVPEGFKVEAKGSDHIYLRNANTQFFILALDEYQSMFSGLEEFKSEYQDDGFMTSSRQNIFYKYNGSIYENNTKTKFLSYGDCESYSRSWESIINWYTGDRFVPDMMLIFEKERGIEGPVSIKTQENGIEASMAELASKDGNTYLIIGISDKYTEEEMLWTSKLMCESITTEEQKEVNLKEITSDDGTLRINIPDYFKDKSKDGVICYEASHDSPYPGTGIMVFTGKNLSFEQIQTEFNKDICKTIYFENLRMPVFEPHMVYTSAEEFPFGENGWKFGTDISISTDNAFTEKEAKYNHGLIGYTYIFKHNSSYKLVCIYMGPNVIREDFDSLADTIISSLH